MRAEDAFHHKSVNGLEQDPSPSYGFHHIPIISCGEGNALPAIMSDAGILMLSIDDLFGKHLLQV